MMISSPSAGDPYAAAAALDRALRSPDSHGDDALASASEDTKLDAGPDVVVTLSQGMSAPATYNASGRLSRAPTLDDMGANGRHLLAHATETDGADASSDATSAASASTGADNSTAPADAQADTAVAA